MTPDQAAEAILLIDGMIPVEVSGRISLETIGAYAQAGVDYISVGAITKHIHAIDLSMRIV
jgi:nicotinate-nucleotide pyrophosphorylase (carboxylating)